MLIFRFDNSFLCLTCSKKGKLGIAENEFPGLAFGKEWDRQGKVSFE
jgi:hypothetical protein